MSKGGSGDVHYSGVDLRDIETDHMSSEGRTGRVRVTVVGVVEAFKRSTEPGSRDGVTVCQAASRARDIVGEVSVETQKIKF